MLLAYTTTAVLYQSLVYIKFQITIPLMVIQCVILAGDMLSDLSNIVCIALHGGLIITRYVYVLFHS